MFADVVGCGKWKRIGVFGRQGAGRPPLSVGFGGIVPMRIPADEIADCRMTAVRYGYVKSSPFGLLRIDVTTRLRAVQRLILFLVEEIYAY